MKTTLGMIVIGQAPRPALITELMYVLGPETSMFLVGALDDLSRAEIDAARPTDGMDTLFTTLPDGASVTVSKAVVTRGVERRLADFSARGIEAAFLCCSGAFPGLVSPIRLIEPDRILTALVAAALPSGRLGLLIPLEEQFEQLAKKHAREGVEIVAQAVAPGSDAVDFTEASKVLTAQGADLIVMDCMGYTAADKALVRSVHSAPIILAISATGRVMEELMS